MYSYKTSSLSAKSTDIDGSENIRILNFAGCTCIYILFFNEWKFSAKDFFFGLTLKGSMTFSLLTTPNYKNTIFIWGEFFDLLREVMPGFKILKTVTRLISQTFVQTIPSMTFDDKHALYCHLSTTEVGKWQWYVETLVRVNIMNSAWFCCHILFCAELQVTYTLASTKENNVFLFPSTCLN